ncbi:hypothetical protein BDA99DRAFT_543666 [Phascolomyces articulosus]|uniref:Uncharacterized protein n=1 Tax=Phascolomyces articulosus TaxID=60185 RepID=A0AAD5P926_9FUNG|nr:hypothetical protein BDA99DRAFT_543666 [Phascolomyces articulosus]
MLNDTALETPLKPNHEILIVSPLPIRPLHSTRKSHVDGIITKEQEEDARSELLEIMTPGSKRRESHPPHPHQHHSHNNNNYHHEETIIVDVPASPVYRTLNPLPHDTSFIHAAAAFLTVQNAMAAMAAAATTNTTVNDNHYNAMDTLQMPSPVTTNTTTTNTTATASRSRTTTRTRSYSVGDDRNKIPAIVC